MVSVPPQFPDEFAKIQPIAGCGSLACSAGILQRLRPVRVLNGPCCTAWRSRLDCTFGLTVRDRHDSIEYGLNGMLSNKSASLRSTRNLTDSKHMRPTRACSSPASEI
jgi:hypothetical protein